jgi:LacI family transcriptional regulator, repressor for deo operon, udp, cdd, tsx, nupC, and nupG
LLQDFAEYAGDVVRLREIAQQAGVSEATVSRVINQKPGVNQQTRDLVNHVMGQLGYEPRGLVRKGRAGLIGLIVPELTNPIFPAFAQGLGSNLALHRYTAVLCMASAGAAAEEDHIDSLLSRGVDGIIVLSGKHADTEADHQIYLTALAKGVPLVLINGFTPGLAANFVSCDDAFAADLAVRHLASLGHERIGCLVGPTRYTPVRNRIAGFEKAIARLKLHGQVLETGFVVEGGHRGGRALLKHGVTGIVAASDLLALGAIRAVIEEGLSVPGDISVVGFDDTALMGFTDPPLTTVRQPVAAMCRAAVQALLHNAESGPAAAEELVFRPELVVRASTGRRHVATDRP